MFVFPCLAPEASHFQLTLDERISGSHFSCHIYFRLVLVHNDVMIRNTTCTSTSPSLRAKLSASSLSYIFILMKAQTLCKFTSYYYYKNWELMAFLFALYSDADTCYDSFK